MGGGPLSIATKNYIIGAAGSAENGAPRTGRDYKAASRRYRGSIVGINRRKIAAHPVREITYVYRATSGEERLGNHAGAYPRINTRRGRARSGVESKLYTTSF